MLKSSGDANPSVELALKRIEHDANELAKIDDEALGVNEDALTTTSSFEKQFAEIVTLASNILDSASKTDNSGAITPNGPGSIHSVADPTMILGALLTR